MNLYESFIEIKFPGLFGGKTKTFAYEALLGVDVKTPLVGYSTISLRIRGEIISAHGFTKKEALLIKKVVETALKGKSVTSLVGKDPKSGKNTDIDDDEDVIIIKS